MVKKYLLLASLFFFFPISNALHAQAIAAARGGSELDAGALFSDFQPDYGPNRLEGIGFYADLNVGSHLGAEAEGRFLRIHQFDQIHEDDYLIGPRYIWRFHRFHPYAKFLLGNGQFNFPASYAHGGYLLLAPGGGLDIRLNRRFTVRAIDYEYQHWSSFQGSSLSPNGFSFGVAYRIF